MSESNKVLGSGEKRKPPAAGMGRKAGVPNKSTTVFRDAVSKLLNDNSENFQKWIEQIALEDPEKAINALTKLADFAAPRLARQEINHSGETGLNISVVNYTHNG